jgi:hypothetical protein
MLAMWPLSMAVALDAYLIGRLIFVDFHVALTAGILIFLFFVALWFVFPLLARAHRPEG